MGRVAVVDLDLRHGTGTEDWVRYKMLYYIVLGYDIIIYYIMLCYIMVLCSGPPNMRL
jgi:acetoin utilization deacetylase AcuC-like enzyme